MYYPQILSVRVHLMVLSSQKGPEDANLNLTVRFLLVKPWGQDMIFSDSRCFRERLMTMGSSEFNLQADCKELWALVLPGSQT